MASLALGVAGAAVGSFFGPLGASLGWSIGAAIGGAIGGKSQHGPRLTDLRAQNSAYGQPIPIGYGTVRIAGNVIWAADLVEHKTKSGGKGGPKVTTYSYTQSFAVGLLETSFIDGAGVLVNNPIVGILRIWADGRLIYGEGSDGAPFPMTVYYGTEDQEADPTIEAAEGIGSAGGVPAHRGMAYVVFTDLPGNRMPNLTFEVIASGSIGLEIYSLWPVDYDYPIDASAYSYPFQLNGVEPIEEGLKLHRYRSGFDYPGFADNVLRYDQSRYDLQGVLLGTESQIELTVGDASSNIDAFGSMNNGIAYIAWNIDIDCGDGVETYLTFAWLKNGGVTYTPPDLCSHGLDRWLYITGSLLYWNGYVYAVGGALTAMWVRRWPASDGSVYQEAHDAEFNLYDYSHDGAPAAADLLIGDDGYLYCRVSDSTDDVGVIGGAGIKLIRLDSDLNLIKHWINVDASSQPFGVPQYSSAVVFRGHYVSYQSAGVFDIGNPNWCLYRLDNPPVFVDELQIPAPTNQSVGALIYIGNSLAAFRGGILTLGTSGTTWGQIVENVSQHVGFDTVEIDVSELTDPVRGYTISTRMTGRAAIEAGMPAYQHGAVESNLQVKFPKWAGALDATVSADDLGARPDDSDPIDPLKITHLDDSQLPRRLEVVYLNYNMDYQEGTQYAARTTSYSDLTVAVNIPIVFIDTEAKAISDTLEFNAWIERDKYAFSLPRKWAYLEPTDIIALDGYAIRIISKEEVGYTHINFEGVGTHTGVFVTAPVAPPPVGFVPQVPPSLNRTDLVLLDIPLITDVDFANGFYAAIAGRMEGPWPGAGVFKSVDGGVNYESIYSTVENDSFGVATTALADFTDGNVFDETNTVTVRLSPGSGELTSSNELGVLNGANMALVGDEVIQFKTATLDNISDGGARTYTLSGLLRGRRGSEWANSTHLIDDNFVLLPCHNLEGIFAELGQERQYKAVSSGGLLSSSIAINFTNNGIALKCYAPVELSGGRNGAGDITLTWVRRTRIGGAWIDNVDAPLSEPFEQYTVAIFSDGTRATLLNAFAVDDAQTYTYTVAAQTTDFGSPQATLYWNVAQNGVYGEGYETEGTT